MPRHVREVNLSTREARKRLAVAKKPYYRSLDGGLHLGYRKSQSGSAWVIRWYKGDGAYGIENLEGRPDDVLAADGVTVLTWNHAQGVVRKLFEQKQRQADGLDEIQNGPYAVKDALKDYMTDYRRRGGKAANSTQTVINALILPSLGEISLAKLTRRRVETWQEELAKAPPRLRTKPGKEQKFRKVDGSSETKRRRKSTANRILNVLKAALNRAHQERKVSTDEAWRTVRAYREADAARVRYLKDEEARQLVKSCPIDFKPLVQAALLTGCRYGELTALVAADYKAEAGTLHIRISKSGKPRHVVLTDEGRDFFGAITDKRSDDALIFTKPDGSCWGASHQQRPFKLACKGAKVLSLTFHELRHTYASRLAMKGVPLAVIAAQLGHSDTRMVEKHYGHMAPSYVADTVRAAFGSLGIVPPSNPVRLAS
jgi:integrase